MSVSLHRRAEHVIALAGASLLIATSATLGATYGYIVGSHHHAALGVVFAAAALGGELLKPFAISSGLQALGSWQPVRALACLAVGLVCVVYSLASELSLVAGGRGDLSAERDSAAQVVTHAKARYDAGAAELDHLPHTRPIGELQALIDGILANPRAGGCITIDGPFSREQCPRVTEWKAELARVERREELEGALRVAEGEMKAGQHVGAADPLAASLAAYAVPLGWTIAPSTITPWLALIPVLFLEIGSAFGLVVVRMVSEAEEMPHRLVDGRGAVLKGHEPMAVDQSRNKVPQVCTGEPPAAGDAAGVGTVRQRQKALTALLKRLDDHGGTMHVSSRSLAELLGVGKGTVHRVLADACSRELVHVATTTRGTIISLGLG